DQNRQLEGHREECRYGIQIGRLTLHHRRIEIHLSEELQGQGDTATSDPATEHHCREPGFTQTHGMIDAVNWIRSVYIRTFKAGVTHLFRRMIKLGSRVKTRHVAENRTAVA